MCDEIQTLELRLVRTRNTDSRVSLFQGRTGLGFATLAKFLLRMHSLFRLIGLRLRGRGGARAAGEKADTDG
jgi:hypothetical protein